MTVSIQNLKIDRIIVQEVLLNGTIESGTVPQLSYEVLRMEEPSAVSAMAKRFQDALGSESHAVEMDVQEDKVGSSFDELTQMLDADESKFVELSQSLAKALTRVQSVGSIKPGIAIFLDGVCGPPSSARRFVAVVKAESDSAFLKSKGNNGLVLQYVRELVLSAQQRLFKIGFFVEIRRGKSKRGEVRSKADFEVLVYDHQMSVGGKTNAARYFHGSFLGCSPSVNAPRLNRIFFEQAVEFFKDPKLKYSNEEKLEKRTHLDSYMKDQRGTISGKGFAELALKLEHRDPFLRRLKAAGFPDRDVPKDLSQISRRLKVRRVSFSSEAGTVRVFAPVDSFGDLVQFCGTEDGWTTLKVKGQPEDQ